MKEENKTAIKTIEDYIVRHSFDGDIDDKLANALILAMSALKFDLEDYLNENELKTIDATEYDELIKLKETQPKKKKYKVVRSRPRVSTDSFNEVFEDGWQVELCATLQESDSCYGYIEYVLSKEEP